jgi:hypothetical protein
VSRPITAERGRESAAASALVPSAATGEARALAAAKVLLTITAIEFFGPILRDSGAGHLFNPSWPGHARVHLVWLLGFMFFSGVMNLYLLWLRRPRDVRDVWLSVAWQACNLGGFWVAYVLAPLYDGKITMPDTHVHILGIDENVFAFAILSIVLAAAVAMLLRATPPRARHAAD